MTKNTELDEMDAEVKKLRTDLDMKSYEIEQFSEIQQERQEEA